MQKVKTYIDSVYDEALSMIKALASIPSPSLKEEWRVSFILNWLKENDIENAFVDGANNVIIPYNDKDAEKYDLFLAHTDVVFSDDMPFKVVEDGDKLSAPGIGDDTANVVALLLFARYVVKNKIYSDYGVLFIANSAEEGIGNLKGSKQICERYKGKINSFTSFDIDLGNVVSEAVGSERYEISLHTIGGHSYSAFGNPNAIVQASQVIGALSEQKLSQEGKTTFNFGTIKGGTSINSIAQDATFTYEFRSNKLIALTDMREQFEAFIERFRAEGMDISVKNIGIRPCSNGVDSSHLITKAVKALEKVDIHATLKPGSTDCNIPLSQGVPAVCFGLVKDVAAHTREEYILKSSIKPGFIAGLTYVLSVLEGTE